MRKQVQRRSSLSNVAADAADEACSADKIENECLSCSSTVVFHTGGVDSSTKKSRIEFSRTNSQNIYSTTFEEDQEEQDDLTSQGSNLNQQQQQQQHQRQRLLSAATLHEIVADVKSGVPSLTEERVKQEKALKKRQVLLNESHEDTQSSVVAVNGQPVQILGERRHSSLSFGPKKTHTKKWTVEETVKFYKSLQIFGTDFSLIARLFPDRTRIQIKNKFRKEERENSKVIESELRLNSKGRFSRVQSRLAAKKKACIPEITSAMAIKDRVEKLIEQRKQRLMSFESVDGADIEIAEEFDEIFEKEIATATSNANGSSSDMYQQ